MMIQSIFDVFVHVIFGGCKNVMTQKKKILAAVFIQLYILKYIQLYSLNTANTQQYSAYTQLIYI